MIIYREVVRLLFGIKSTLDLSVMRVASSGMAQPQQQQEGFIYFFSPETNLFSISFIIFFSLPFDKLCVIFFWILFLFLMNLTRCLLKLNFDYVLWEEKCTYYFCYLGSIVLLQFCPFVFPKSRSLSVLHTHLLKLVSGNFEVMFSALKIT